ncbi:MAG: hypothetical protein LBQ36_07175 [Synergistaceae bacterium]|jgi:hypothetical protein|nr:hypothetical protein [Synergistaceae bacterium]
MLAGYRLLHSMFKFLTAPCRGFINADKNADKIETVTLDNVLFLFSLPPVEDSPALATSGILRMARSYYPPAEDSPVLAISGILEIGTT